MEGSLIDFTAGAWASIDAAPFKSNWALDASAEHLQAVTEGHIKRLLINVPFRTGKSRVASVCWPAWTWARRQVGLLSGPQVQFLCSSHGHSLSLELSNLTRRLILSPWYQRRWGSRFRLTADQNTKYQFDNDQKGSRIATSVGGGLLGIGGMVILIDDPHDTEGAESEADRLAVLNHWKEISTTRLNDPANAAIVVIMQRLHEEDVSGVILSEHSDFVHLMIPMEYEWRRHCVTVLGWEDPRGLDDDGQPLVVVDGDGARHPRDLAAARLLDEEREGELMWPERFGPDEVASITATLGPYMASGRLQQAPQPKGGGIFQRDWWQFWDSRQAFEPQYVVASLDSAFTENEENDPSALTVWGVMNVDGRIRIVLMDAWRKYLHMHGELPLQMPYEKNHRGIPNLEYITRCQRIVPRLPREDVHEYYERIQKKHWGLVEWAAHTCRERRVNLLLVEGKASGLTAAQELRRIHGREGWGIQVQQVKGDKRARALAVQPLFSQGLIYAPDKDWAELVIDEMSKFPKGAYDDLTDSATQALSHLRSVGFARRDEEDDADRIDRARHYKKPKALYPGMRVAP